MGQRVVLHVGCPKTGTTAIQHALFENSADLAIHGFNYPAYRIEEHFLAAVDLIGLEWGWGFDAQEVEGAWDLLSERARASTEDVVVSHELLALANQEQVARAASSFGDAAVEVVVTARDLRRQIPAEYQEFLKYRHSATYQEFLECLRQPGGEGEAAYLAAEAWRHQDVVAIARRWAEAVGPGNVTIVTLPPSGVPRNELLRRFSEAIGLDMVVPPASDFSTENRSLGVVEVEMLRRFNEDVGASLSDADYAEFARVRLVPNMTTDAASPPLDLPPEDFDWVRRRSCDLVRDLAADGYRVVGDLNDLIPAPPREFTDPEAVEEGEVLDAALRALASSVIDFGTAQQEFAQSRQGRWAAVKTRCKRNLVLRAERNAIGQRVLRVWRQRKRVLV